MDAVTWREPFKREAQLIARLSGGEAVALLALSEKASAFHVRHDETINEFADRIGRGKRIAITSDRAGVKVWAE